MGVGGDLQAGNGRYLFGRKKYRSKKGKFQACINRSQEAGPWGAQEFAALITLRIVLEVVLKTRGLGESLCKKQSGP